MSNFRRVALIVNISTNSKQASPIRIYVLDVLGRTVETVVTDKAQSAGLHQIQYVPINLQGGMYWLVLRTAEGQVEKKVFLKR